MKVSLLTGSVDPHYQLDLLSGLLSQGVRTDFIGSDSMANSSVLRHNNVNFLNFRGDQSPDAPLLQKIYRIVKYYYFLIKYAGETDSKIFHIQWPNKFVYFDRTILNLYFKLLGKRLIHTAHNINSGERDENDNILNRLSLRFMYKITDQIIVHTEKMKSQLINDFNVRQTKIYVIPHGINNAVPYTDITQEQAKKNLNIPGNKKVLLFFGNITIYKGLDYLLHALGNLKHRDDNLCLLIAGRKKVDNAYWESIENIIRKEKLESFIVKHIKYIPDSEIEFYFKSADVLILPYKNIFQSGILFIAYRFGLPVIATDVGSLREDIIEGKTGYICRPQDPIDLTEKIELYFKGDLYRNLEANRYKIIEYANEKYSWEKIGEKTCYLYEKLL